MIESKAVVIKNSLYMETSTSTDYLAPIDKMPQPTNTKKCRFCHLTLYEILTIICVASIPLALGIYTAISSDQQQTQAEKDRQFELKQSTELRQQVLYDKYISDMYKLDKDGYLKDDKDPWAFANAYHRAVQRQWDAIRKADILIFLKERELIGKAIRPTKRLAQSSNNIIQLNKLNFDNIIIKSQTGSLNHLDFNYISFDEVSMVNSRFSFVNLDRTTFNQARLNHVKFDDSSLAYAIFNGTNLQEADFGNSNLTRTQFLNTDLFTAKLTQEQLNEAIFFNTRLPNGTMVTSITTATSVTSTTTPTTSDTSTTTTATSDTSTTTATSTGRIFN
jgi:uncharacterized protein YjbI with pentapeptide repeats